jgi:hypothetical protein
LTSHHIDPFYFILFWAGESSEPHRLETYFISVPFSWQTSRAGVSCVPGRINLGFDASRMCEIRYRRGWDSLVGDASPLAFVPPFFPSGKSFLKKLKLRSVSSAVRHRAGSKFRRCWFG